MIRVNSRLYQIFYLMIWVFIIARPVLACQLSTEMAGHDKMACCLVQGSCHTDPKAKADCCQSNKTLARDVSRTVLPPKVSLNSLANPHRGKFIAFDTEKAPMESLLLGQNIPLLKKSTRYRLPTKIFLLNSSFLI